MPPPPPSLPSILPSQPAIQDSTFYLKKFFIYLLDLVSTTPEQFQAALNLGKVTAPDQSVHSTPSRC